MSNSSESSESYYAFIYELSYRNFHDFFFVWAFPLVMAVGAWGNLSCLIVLLRNQSCFPFSARLSMLITCFVDFLMVAGKSVTHYLSPSVMGEILEVPNYRTKVNYFVCVLYYFFTIWLIHGSPFLRLGLCHDRLVVTLLPLRRAQLLRMRNVILYQVMLLLISLVPCVRLFSTFWSTKRSKCIFRSDDIGDFYRVFTLFVSRLAVLSIILITMLIIVVTLSRNHKRMRDSVNSSSSRKRDVGAPVGTVAAIFISTSVIFIISEMPFAILKFLYDLDFIPNSTLRKQWAIYTNHLVYLNAALNWIPYLLGNRYRQMYRQTFCCVCRHFSEKNSETELAPTQTGWNASDMGENVEG